MFSIGENGDIFIHNDGTFTDYVIGDIDETNFRIARSRIISHFKFRKYFENNFIKYFRNNFSDEQIKEKINNELNNLFIDNKNIKEKILFFYRNSDDKFNIVFLYKLSKNTNKNICYFSIDC